jgi:NADP-dependent 3-hydroxy acid dehydrogenase YdfG
LAKKFEGSIHYKQVDVQDAKDLDKVVGEIASEYSRMDGLIAAAGVQNVTPALDYPPEKIGEVSTVMFHDRVW